MYERIVHTNVINAELHTVGLSVFTPIANTDPAFLAH